jgi:ABC-type protease/lipase transport system fused ATPase/permease subunit
MKSTQNDYALLNSLIDRMILNASMKKLQASESGGNTEYISGIIAGMSMVEALVKEWQKEHEVDYLEPIFIEKPPKDWS